MIRAYLAIEDMGMKKNVELGNCQVLAKTDRRPQVIVFLVDRRNRKYTKKH